MPDRNNKKIVRKRARCVADVNYIEHFETVFRINRFSFRSNILTRTAQSQLLKIELCLGHGPRRRFSQN